MNSPKINIKPFGVHSVLIEWPNEVSEIILEKILHFERFLNKEVFTNKEWELVPSYNSLLIINRTKQIDFQKLSSDINNWYVQLKESQLWGKIHRAAQTNVALADILEQAKMVYALIKKETN